MRKVYERIKKRLSGKPHEKFVLKPPHKDGFIFLEVHKPGSRKNISATYAIPAQNIRKAFVWGVSYISAGVT
jgi:hypothetical protein